MPNCKCCGKPVVSGVVFHTECLGESFDTEKAMNFIEQFAFLTAYIPTATEPCLYLCRECVMRW